ncbi:hypothetical protein [Streptomyces sp. NPDC050504]|uniref:hypothetical protein n=1 Tax=Streptomyces sp. NPDC050504 TaxID=3365618 RepID=UPI0037A37094
MGDHELGAPRLGVLPVVTFVFSAGVYLWWFALRGLFVAGECGVRGEEECGAGTGWRIIAILLLTPLMLFLLSLIEEEHSMERRGHEFHWITLLSVPALAASDLIQASSVSRTAQVAGLLTVISAAALIVSKVKRTAGFRGMFWLMDSSRMIMLGVDPGVRILSTGQNFLYLAGNIFGSLLGWLAAAGISVVVW